MKDSPLDIPLPSIDKSGENKKYHAFVNLALVLAAVERRRPACCSCTSSLAPRC